MTKDEILADLRAVYGRQVLLSPADIAVAIGRSPKAQANMRSRGVFPIPIKRAGGKVGISIYDLADYLAGSAPSPAPAVSGLPRTEAELATSSAKPSPPAHAKPSKAAGSAAAAQKPWLPARRRKSLGPELIGFREALDFWGAVHAELEAAEIMALTRPRGD